MRMNFVGFQCDKTEDCITGECVEDVKGVKRCVCAADEIDHPVAMIRGVQFEWKICLKLRSHGQKCLVDKQCSERMPNSFCEGVSAVSPGECVCDDHFKPINISGLLACKPDRIGGQCITNEDCSAIKMLSDNGRELNMSDITSVCTRQDNATETSQRCSCPPGFKILADGSACQDINECASQFPDGPCTADGRDNPAVLCVNRPGSYECKCQYKFGIDNGNGDKGICCEAGHFPCRSGSRCFKLDEFCNGVPDCLDDCSDEKMYFCNFNDVYPAPDYRLYPQCLPESLVS
ncbi:fibulin-1-like isoform X2 [Paramacrobiotus metropolitanus]|nr:fibulin-1-like isoform X2 [Paramacrobiotus metropolitanus]